MSDATFATSETLVLSVFLLIFHAQTTVTVKTLFDDDDGTDVTPPYILE